MSQPRQGVLIAIDWENIRRGAHLYQKTVKPAQLCQAMQDVGGIFGEVAGGKAFGDWSLRPDDGREFSEHDIVPLPRSPHQRGQGPVRSGHPAGGLRVDPRPRRLRHGAAGIRRRRLPGPGGPGQDLR